jgi:hypothetical protein
MDRIDVSILNGSGATLSSAEFSSPKIAKDFVEWRIDEFLDRGAAVVVIVDKAKQTEIRYCANGIADCVFMNLNVDWRYATLRDAA